MHSNKVEYITSAEMYCTTHDVKVKIFMVQFYSSKIIQHIFHIDNNESESGIGYYMIIANYLIMQIGLLDDFKHQVIQQDFVIVPMKEPIGLLCQTDLTSCEIREVVIQTEEPVSTREDTQRLVKVLNGTYVKSYL